MTRIEKPYKKITHIMWELLRRVEKLPMIFFPVILPCIKVLYIIFVVIVISIVKYSLNISGI